MKNILKNIFGSIFTGLFLGFSGLMIAGFGHELIGFCIGAIIGIIIGPAVMSFTILMYKLGESEKYVPSDEYKRKSLQGQYDYAIRQANYGTNDWVRKANKVESERLIGEMLTRK